MYLAPGTNGWRWTEAKDEATVFDSALVADHINPFAGTGVSKDDMELVTLLPKKPTAEPKPGVLPDFHMDLDAVAVD